MKDNDILKDLAQTTYDSVEGYRVAAQRARNPELKQALGRRTIDRAKAYQKLNRVLKRRGVEEITTPSTRGAASRLLTIADTLADGDKAALDRVAQSEEFIAREYRKALRREDIQPATRQLIESAYRSVRDGERFDRLLEPEYA